MSDIIILLNECCNDGKDVLQRPYQDIDQSNINLIV